ncbi:MAG: thymidine kinase [Deltaproteobacteria bacterium]|nr:thymidine kinase [Deltaproteobacteria bacterium]
MHLQPLDTGWIEVICGSMFSGKTEELIRRLRRAQIARQRVIIFKPRLDNRYHAEQIVSHNDQRMESIPIDRASEILERLPEGVEVVGIDEAQFFDAELVGVCETLADRGIRVIVAGLDQDYRGEPFEPVPQLLAVAEFITKNLAICVRCGNPANRSQRIAASEEQLLVGAADSYEARCRRCWTAEPEPAGTGRDRPES